MWRRRPEVGGKSANSSAGGKRLKDRGQDSRSRRDEESLSQGATTRSSSSEASDATIDFDGSPPPPPTTTTTTAAVTATGATEETAIRQSKVPQTSGSAEDRDKRERARNSALNNSLAGLSEVGGGAAAAAESRQQKRQRRVASRAAEAKRSSQLRGESRYGATSSSSGKPMESGATRRLLAAAAASTVAAKASCFNTGIAAKSSSTRDSSSSSTSATASQTLSARDRQNSKLASTSNKHSVTSPSLANNNNNKRQTTASLGKATLIHQNNKPKSVSLSHSQPTRGHSNKHLPVNLHQKQTNLLFSSAAAKSISTNFYHQSSKLNSFTHSTKTTANHLKMADQAVIDKLEAGFAKLQASSPEQCHSLLKKYLTREVLDKLKSRKTAMGATLLDVVQSGFENLDSGVGIYAPDAESYTLFAELFNPIIEDYHGGFKPTDKHPASDFGDLGTLVNVDPNNEFVISTRVRCGRSLKGYPFNPCLTEGQYKEMEAGVTSAFKEMEGDLAGTYYPLTGMTKDTQQQLIDDHFLFKEGDRFLQAANACRYWPTGRGIYHNAAKTFLVWVNEEDHLRIISMQKGGDLKTVFGRLVQGAKAIEAKVPFSRDERLGFLTFCPTNLGTTIRASVHIKLPKLAADRKKLEEVAGRYNLQVRGTSGEHTESIGGIYDISNKRRLGLTEYQAVREMQDGILELIKIEKSL